MFLIDYINNGLEFSGIFRIPFYRSSKESYEKLYRSAAFFPLTGILIFLFFYFVNMVSFDIDAKAFIFVLIYSVCTRALHIDGFVDCLDAFFGGYTKEKRLEILKDSRLGVFATCGVFFLLGGKFFIYKFLLEGNNLFYILPAFLVSRNLFIFIGFKARYPREKGLGKVFVENMGLREILISFIFFAFCVYMFFPDFYLYFGVIYLIGIVFAFLCRFYFYRMIGGITGDCLGAFIEICEVFTLLLMIYILN